MDALGQANVVRTWRARIKRDLKAGRLNVADLIESPDERLETMKVFDLLMAVPKIGRVKANKMLQTLRVSGSKTVGGLSDRQRDEMVRWLRTY